MTRQLNLYDYLTPAERLPAMYDDYRPAHVGSGRCPTARSALLAAPAVHEDPAGYTAASEAASAFLRLDPALAHPQLIGSTVSWPVWDRKVKAHVTLTGTVIACVAQGEEVGLLALLPEEVLALKGQARRGVMRFPLRAACARYIVAVGGGGGVVYWAAPAKRVNRENQKLILEVMKDV